MGKFGTLSQKPEMLKLHTRGISLVEVLIGVVLMSVAVLAFLCLYNTGQKYFVNQDARSDILKDGRVTLSWLCRDIKESVRVVSGPVDIGGTAYSTAPDSIVLQVPSIDADGLIIDVDTHFDYLVYRVNPDDTTELQRIVDGKDGVSYRLDGSRILAGNIDSLVLSYLDTDGGTVADYADSAVVDIALTTLKEGVQRTYQETITTRTKLRNKGVS
ncbi:MAG: hypothetical protein PVF22_05060 [Candidatus Aminicenantes bacterium]|jgi:hypothetical protein